MTIEQHARDETIVLFQRCKHSVHSVHGISNDSHSPRPANIVGALIVAYARHAIKRLREIRFAAAAKHTSAVAVAKRIIDEVIVPAFKRGDFYDGISAGVDSMMRVIEGELLPEPAVKNDKRASGPDLLPLILLAALVISGFMRALLGRVKGALVASGLLGLAVWLLYGIGLLAILAAVVVLLITLAGGCMGSGWQGGRRQGGFHRYGDGGGDRQTGWGGFQGGGGGFGGGGASGRW